MERIEEHGEGLDLDGPAPTIHSTARIRGCDVGEWTLFQRETKLVESTIKDYTYVMERSEVFYAGLRKFCSVASNVRINALEHPIDRVTSHPIIYRNNDFDLGEDDGDVFDRRKEQPVDIGHDVWIGSGAIIMPDTTVGNGAVVGAGSVVIDDVDPYTVVAGVPAEQIRRRFSPSVSEKIEEVQWWNWSKEELRENMELLRNSEAFVSEL